MKWKPPNSPYKLLQEQLWKDPWKIFVCCIFCNLTRRVQSEPVFWETLRRWPTPSHLANANKDELIDLISPLGLAKKRAKALTKMSAEYLTKNWKSDPTKLYGIGKYGSDAYKIFCTDQWHETIPKDGALVNYKNYLNKLYNR